mmetsp:Transcript_7253/g.9458  ORF Transcript_7253/g.9458 Transcript_7253/m.9458 type:complete len:503 (+) Transcript_7253:148-1656(+)
MDPEGRKNAPDQTDHLCGSEEGILSGKAIWAYRKDIFTAVIVPDHHIPSDTIKIPTGDDSSVDSSELPALIPAQIYSSGKEATYALSEEEKEEEKEKADKWLLSSIYKYSLIFGLLIGCFIQSSSLGANYILMIVFGRDFEVMKQHQEHIVAFSLAWSFITSLMGIVILLIIRSLISLACHGLNKSSVDSVRPTIFYNRRLSLVANLEFPFAFGAMAGVCASWAATDLVLGLKSHAYHSLLTLAVAYVGKTLFEVFSNRFLWKRKENADDDENVNESRSRLLPSDSRRNQLVSHMSAEEKVQRIHTEFKAKGLATGLLVGFFIQFSSLGASFLIDSLVNDNKDASGNVVSPLSKDDLLLFSLGWSFVFGTMGVTILLLLRYLVGIVCDHIISQSESSDSEVRKNEAIAEKWSVSLEFYFAAGCLIGVNLAWLLTDVGLGLNAHILRSFLTLAAAAAWCCVMSHCFGFKKVISASDIRSTKDPESTKMVTIATQTTREGLLLV